MLQSASGYLLLTAMDGELLLLGVRGVELTMEEETLFRKLKPAGFILFSRNIESAAQTRKLTDDLRTLCYDDPIISIDQEGGRVERTKGFSPALPSASAFAQSGDMEQMARAGEVTADFLRMLGFNLNYSPVLDLDHFPGVQNGLNQRCWGRDSQDVISRAGIWNRWTRKRGMLGCGKHFPACGRAKTDPHEDLPTSDATKDELMREDILPYTALMPELDAVMLAHVTFTEIDPDFPASLSKKVITDWLRGQLGFDHHLMLTDDLDMGAIRDRYGRGEDVKMAIRAGNDLAMICHEVDSADLAARALGELPIGLREDARARLARFRKKMSAPLKWSDQRLAQIYEDIAGISALVPEMGESDTRSAVTKY